MIVKGTVLWRFNALRPEQNKMADDIVKNIFWSDWAQIW